MNTLEKEEKSTEKILLDAETAAAEISSVPKDKEGLAAALSRAFASGIRIGAGMHEEKASA